MTLQKFQKQYFLQDYAENIEVSKMRIIKKKEPDEEKQNKVNIKKGINKSPWNNLLANFSGTIWFLVFERKFYSYVVLAALDFIRLLKGRLCSPSISKSSP